MACLSHPARGVSRPEGGEVLLHTRTGVVCLSHLETTHLAERSHGLGASYVRLLLQVTLGQPVPLQDLVKSL